MTYAPVDMKQISQELNTSLKFSGYDDDCTVNMGEVLGAIGKLKLGKSDGNGVLSTDHFKYAGPELSVYIAMLLNALVIHGCTPDDLVTSTIIPIPKGRGVNITDSANYRGIALSSIYGKILDQIILSKFSDKLVSNHIVVWPLAFSCCNVAVHFT